MIYFFVAGHPGPAGSKRGMALWKGSGAVAIKSFNGQRWLRVAGKDEKVHGSRALMVRDNGSPVIVVMDANQKNKEWQSTIAKKGLEFALPELIEGPIEVVFSFIRCRPKNHFRTNGELSKAGLASHYPTGKPDALKLARAAEDALTGVLWKDDAQIVRELITKEWGMVEGVGVKVSELG